VVSAVPLRIAWFYPDRLNTYADRGNILVLRGRCHRRAIACEVTRIGLGEAFAPDAFDLIYLGGGQDLDQRRCSTDLLRHREQLAESVALGAVVLGVCGGFQLLGHRYRFGGDDLEGVGLLDVTTEAPEDPARARLVGPAVIDVTAPGLAMGEDQRLAGFENHRGRTTLGPDAVPLGRVVAGHGNDGEGRTEGAVDGHVIGTYLHGPLLAKNAWFADRLIHLATKRALPPVTDRFERAVHRAAVDRALRPS
jgi:CobQ-like glutamine amidotransferase family enzyme